MRPAPCHPSRPHHARGLCKQCYSAEPDQRFVRALLDDPERRKARNVAYRTKHADELREERRLKYAAQRPERLARAAAERAAKRAERR
jgi:hypothetical protein